VGGAPHLLVVVQDDDHVLVQEARMIHGFICHAASDGPIANNSNAVILPALHAQSNNVSESRHSSIIAALERRSTESSPGQTLKSRATAIPRAADMEVEECPAPNGSYSLSNRFVKPVGAQDHIKQWTMTNWIRTYLLRPSSQ
jgi:hypothetical protein